MAFCFGLAPPVSGMGLPCGLTVSPRRSTLLISSRDGRGPAVPIGLLLIMRPMALVSQFSTNDVLFTGLLPSTSSA